MRCRSLPLIHECIAGLSKLGPKAVEGNMMFLLSVSDVWIIWNSQGQSVGSVYFTPYEPGCALIHGGFWDKRLFDKAGVMQALVNTRKESMIVCPLLKDRVGRLWAWWLKKNLGFEEGPPYKWAGDDTMIMERKRCPQQ
jgi:hypothetical protein